MKFMIRSDIEGVTGVTTYQQAEGDPWGRAMLMSDLLGCIEGLLSTGQHEIVIYDEHTDGRNVAVEHLPQSVSVICGKPPYRPDWGGIDASFDAMLMVGFHAMSGVAGSLLPHSYSRKNLALRLNGVQVGEIGMEAAVAADFGVPTWLITGDSAGMAEAQAILPGVRTVTVKEAMGEFAAQCYPANVTRQWIYDAAREVVTNPPQVKTLRFDGPVTLEVEIAASDYLNKFRSMFGGKFVNENTVAIVAKTAIAAWAEFCRLQKEAKKA